MSAIDGSLHPLNERCGPAHQMKIEDHHASPDWGRSVAASDQRWNQYEKLSSEGFRAAFEYAAEQLLLKPFGWRYVDGSIRLGPL